MDSQLRGLFLSTLAGLLISADLYRMATGRYGSFGLVRQTPAQRAASSSLGVAVWGLDTGLPWSTVRASSLPLIASAASLLGFGIWWQGLLYGIGSIGTLWVICARQKGLLGVSHDAVRLSILLVGQRDRARIVGMLGCCAIAAVGVSVA